jgi:uncharacterized protein (UPF0333 family)
MGRRGQSTVEYIMLLCMCVLLVLMVGAFVAKFGAQLLDVLADRIIDAVLTLAMP